MESLSISDIGAAGIFIVLVLRETRHIINARRGNGHGERRQANGDAGAGAIRGKVHEMHRVIMREVDGVPMVYRHPDIAEALEKIASNTDQANVHLQAIRNGGGGAG